MSSALQDLDALMVKARDMVALAADLNQRLTSSTSASASASSPALISSSTAESEPEEATFIRSSLSQLGLQMENAPVTLDMMKDERRWVEELAKELAGILQSQSQSQRGLMSTRPILSLDEVWGGWNRARGVALLPPSTLLQVLPHLPAYTDPPIHMRTLSSGLMVLHTPEYGREAFAERVKGILTGTGRGKGGGVMSTTEIARHLQGMTIGLVLEMMSVVEGDGEVCRDDARSVIDERREGEAELGGMVVLGEVKWAVNVFRGWVWDGEA